MSFGSVSRPAPLAKHLLLKSNTSVVAVHAMQSPLLLLTHVLGFWMMESLFCIENSYPTLWAPADTISFFLHTKGCTRPLMKYDGLGSRLRVNDLVLMHTWAGLSAQAGTITVLWLRA